MEQFMELIKPLIEAYAGGYGVTIQILTIMASLRAINKPVIAIITAYVAYTPNPEDDSLPQRIMANRYYKIFCFILDYAASIKLPQKPKEVVSKEENKQ